MAGDGKTQPHPRAALAGPEVGRIFQLDLAAMVFQHAADDGEAQARPLVPCGDLGFEQPLAGYLRQADAIVDDVNHDVVVVARGDDINATLAIVLG